MSRTTPESRSAEDTTASPFSNRAGQVRSESSVDGQTLEEAVEYVLGDCFFAVGQTVGMRTTVDYDAVVWWHDHFRSKFLAAMRGHGNRWLQDRDNVTAVGWMLAERAVRHATGRDSIDVDAARRAAADANGIAKHARSGQREPVTPTLGPTSSGRLLVHRLGILALGHVGCDRRITPADRGWVHAPGALLATMGVVIAPGVRCAVLQTQARGWARSVTGDAAHPVHVTFAPTVRVMGSTFVAHKSSRKPGTRGTVHSHETS